MAHADRSTPEAQHLIRSLGPDEAEALFQLLERLSDDQLAVFVAALETLQLIRDCPSKALN